MATKRETRLQRKIKKAIINVFGGWFFKVHGSQYQPSGIPDLLGCIKGLFVAIEVKTPTGKLSLIQEETIRDIKTAGGIAFVATSPEEAIAKIKESLENVLPPF